MLAILVPFRKFTPHMSHQNVFSRNHSTSPLLRQDPLKPLFLFLVRHIDRGFLSAAFHCGPGMHASPATCQTEYYRARTCGQLGVRWAVHLGPVTWTTRCTAVRGPVRCVAGFAAMYQIRDSDPIKDFGKSSCRDFLIEASIGGGVSLGVASAGFDSFCSGAGTLLPLSLGGDCGGVGGDLRAVVQEVAVMTASSAAKEVGEVVLCVVVSGPP
jgi:hypothetical protein